MIPITKPFLGEEEKSAVSRVLSSGNIAQGAVTRAFEEEFARHTGSKHAIMLSSGTAALIACLHAAGIKEGDEVITTPFTFIATASAISYHKACPVFVDIDEKTFNIDVSKVESAITPKTKAIIPVDLYGCPHDYHALRKLADKHNLLIIEDACQAINAEYHGKKAGTLGDMAAFSLYATKNITSGEGGIITTDNPVFADSIRRFINIGQKARYDYQGFGVNFRTTDIQAAIALEQLKKLQLITDKRIANASFFQTLLHSIPGLTIPSTPPSHKHVYHQFTLRIANGKRDAVLEKLKEKGIGAAVYYPQSLHLTSPYIPLGYKLGDFPVAEKASQEVFSLPVHPHLTQAELEYIVKSVKEACA